MPVALGQNILPNDISGVPIPSQGKEGNTVGAFILSNITPGPSGTFTAKLSYSFAHESKGSVGDIEIDIIG